MVTQLLSSFRNMHFPFFLDMTSFDNCFSYFFLFAFFFVCIGPCLFLLFFFFFLCVSAHVCFCFCLFFFFFLLLPYFGCKLLFSILFGTNMTENRKYRNVKRNYSSHLSEFITNSLISKTLFLSMFISFLIMVGKLKSELKQLYHYCFKLSSCGM